MIEAPSIKALADKMVEQKATFGVVPSLIRDPKTGKQHLTFWRYEPGKEEACVAKCTSPVLTEADLDEGLAYAWETLMAKGV